MAERVEIVEVSPRDGLQNEATILPTRAKVELIARLVGAGVRRLEATSFVNPARVPAMADAEAVMAAVPRTPGVGLIGLVLNERGLDRAIAAGCDEVGYAVPATDSFSLRNQGTTTDEAIEVWARIGARAVEAGLAASLVVSTAFGCPFEGEVPTARVAEVVERSVAACVPSRLGLGDTIGVGTPSDVVERFAVVAASVPAAVELAAHFHNTRNTGIANVYAALEAGVRSFDASIGGIGGCPFAPRATGNVPTEDVVYMLHRMGFETGLDLDALAAAADWLADLLPGSVVGLYSRAGPFPRTAPIQKG